jgi:hypothetical protein
MRIWLKKLKNQRKVGTNLNELFAQLFEENTDHNLYQAKLRVFSTILENYEINYQKFVHIQRTNVKSGVNTLLFGN